MAETIKLAPASNAGGENDASEWISISRVSDPGGAWHGGMQMQANLFYAMCKQVAQAGIIDKEMIVKLAD